MKTAKELCEEIKNREAEYFKQELNKVIDSLYNPVTIFKTYYERDGKYFETTNYTAMILKNNYDKFLPILNQLGYKVEKTEFEVDVYKEHYDNGGFFSNKKWGYTLVKKSTQVEITISACCGEE